MTIETGNYEYPGMFESYTGEKIEETPEQEVTFALGSKKLILTYNSETSRATSYIEKILSAKNREPEETTNLYREMLNYLQEQANNTKKPIFYTFTTKSKKLIAWAKEAGNSVFNWDESDIRMKGSNQHMFEVTIYPQNSEETIH